MNKDKFKTLSGFSVEPLYTPEHVADMDYLRDLGFPGEEPYIRGVHPTVYRGRTWTQLSFAGYDYREAGCTAPQPVWPIP